MAFPLTVVTDLYGKKYTASLEFPAVPSLSELILSVERQFEAEARARDGPAFKVQTMQVYDDVLQRWADLYNPSQLRPGMQVFAFQPVLPVVASPAATAAAVVPDYLGSPSRARVATELGASAALSEKLRRMYRELELSHSVVRPAVLRDYFARYEVEFPVADEWAAEAGVGFEAWAQWGLKHVALVDALYSARFGVRLDRALYAIPEHVPPTPSEAANIAERRARELELRRSYTLGWAAEREAVDRQYRAQRKAELDLQIRHLTTKNKLDRIRAAERADADAQALSLAMIANAASPPRRREDLCRMYYSPASPKFGYLSP